MKPMLSATIKDVADIRYPVLASPKLDGVRCLITEDANLVSRTLKPIPNPHVNDLFGHWDALRGLDGELISGDPTASDVYRQTVGDVSRESGEPDVALYVFDNWTRTGTFEDFIRTEIPEAPGVHVLPQHWIKCENELLRYEQDTLDLGYEGLILRSPEGKYKFGRSTMKEQGMMKLKRMASSEAKILEVIEEMHNGNEAKTNELGRTARSSSKAGLRGTARAGALRVVDCDTGVEFAIGTGLNDKDRSFYWANRESIVGKVISYDHFTVGVKDKPRFPSYKGLREPFDFPALS